jgi:stress response protein SCP2
MFRVQLKSLIRFGAAARTPPPGPPLRLIALTTGQTMVLTDAMTPSAARLRLTCQHLPGRPGMDLGCISYDLESEVLDYVWSRATKGLRGTVRLTAAAGSPSLEIDLSAIPPSTAALVFTVNSPTAPGFSEPVRMEISLLSGGRSEAEAWFDLPAQPGRTGVIAASLRRQEGEWALTVINASQDGKTVRAMVGPAKRFLQQSGEAI